MKQLHLLYLIVLISLAGLTGCMKDEGNYTYVEPNNLEIRNIADNYSVLQGSYLQIIPNLVPSDPAAVDSARYTYEWISLMMGATSLDMKRVLGYNRSLQMTMNLPAGKYTMYYRVKDTLSGIQFQKSFMIEVTSAIYEGWMAMTDVNGKARLDMISKLNNQYRVIPDVLTFAGSDLKLQGKPVNINCFKISALSTGYGIYISTDKTTDRVDPETFQYKSTLNIKYEMLSNVPETFAPAAFANAGAYRVFMLEGTDVYYYYYVMNIRFGLPINLLKGETIPFQVAPFIATSTATTATCLYDNTNKRFVRHVGDDGSCGLMPEGTLFDWKTGKDLVYMAYTTFNNGNVYAILRDPVSGKYYLARFLFGNNIQQVYYEEMTATDMAQAANFAVNPDFGYIFYTVGSKLYSYDMSLKTSKLMIDKGSKSFSMLQFRGSTLVAGSVDPAQPEGANGTLEEYTVPPVQGDLVLVNTWNGLGKIVAASYRTR
ncbi:PKD-like family lipoprotein [Paraflavitalea pollutisoli]|uniref:PKD-like family lipoprotein n=1 Tax=Paraflavitalea pollutisoli TaxID=3034143 RepID=UPI0023EBAA2C|nr:PKD-like family lipoprotein [Paraflavitalea sp. H1-2-19X]